MPSSVAPRIEIQPAELEDCQATETHPYRAIDPFTASFSPYLKKRRHNTINSVDELGPTPSIAKVRQRPLSGLSRTTGSSQSIPDLSAMECVPYSQGTNGISPPAGPSAYEAATLESRGRPAGINPYTPHRRGALDTTTMGLDVPFELHNIQQKIRSPYHPDTRSASPASARDSRYHGRAPGNFSETFLAGHTDIDIEKATHFNHVYKSPTVADEETPRSEYIKVLITRIIPGQIYLHCLLRLPYMYFSRVDQIFVDAHLTLEEIKEMGLRDSAGGQSPYLRRSKLCSKMPKSYVRLKKDWEEFIDNLMREWKTLNIISGLLLSGILSIFQIEGANTDALTRYAALCSLICALLSLMYGCFFIIRFSGMRRVYKATEWAIEAQRDQTMVWNVWVMLALPAIWLVWSILAYVACIMSFMWRVRPGIIVQLEPRLDFALRVFVCCIFCIGLTYAALIINTLRRYGSNMDKAWKRRIEGLRYQSSPECEPRTPGSVLESPSVDVVPPTPPGRRTLQTHSAMIPPSFVPPTVPRGPDAQVSASISRRPDSPASSTNSESYPDSLPAIPIISSALHSSPEPMRPMEIPPMEPPDTGSDEIQLTSRGDQEAGLGIGFMDSRKLSERMPPPAIGDPGPSKSRSVRRSQENLARALRTNLKPVRETSESRGTLESDSYDIEVVPAEQPTEDPPDTETNNGSSLQPPPRWEMLGK